MRLRASIKKTQYLHLYGDGRLWRDATKISSIQADQGIEVKDPKLIRALLQNFRCTNQTVDQDLDSESYGYIHVDFMGAHRPFLDRIEYIRQNKTGYYLKSRADSSVVRMVPGYGPHFEAYVRNLARRIHAHTPGVAVWNIDAS